MKFETAETWPDKSGEYKAIAVAAKQAQVDGKAGVRVVLFESEIKDGEATKPPAVEDLDKLRATLRTQLAKFGRFDVVRDGLAAFVRVSTSAPRTRKSPAAKKAAAGGKK